VAQGAKRIAPQRAVWRNGDITPQTILWEIERLSPAATAVEAATAPSRRDVSGNLRTEQWYFENKKQ
jgi:hypothetical protein